MSGGGDAGWGDAGGGSGADRVHVASFAELTPLTLYRILRLRSSVFSVEQACAYNDLDGRDIEAATLHRGSTPTLPVPPSQRPCAC